MMGTIWGDGQAGARGGGQRARVWEGVVEGWGEGEGEGEETAGGRRGKGQAGRSNALALKMAARNPNPGAGSEVWWKPVRIHGPSIPANANPPSARHTVATLVLRRPPPLTSKLRAQHRRRRAAFATPHHLTAALLPARGCPDETRVAMPPRMVRQSRAPQHQAAACGEHRDQMAGRRQQPTYSTPAPHRTTAPHPQSTAAVCQMA